MIIKFVIKFLPTCLPSGLTAATPDAFGRIPGVKMIKRKFVNIEARIERVKYSCHNFRCFCTCMLHNISCSS